MRAARSTKPGSTHWPRGMPDDRRIGTRRSTLVAVVALLWIGLVFTYTWGAGAMTLYRLLVDGSVLLLWLSAGLGVGAWLLPLFRATDGSGGSALLGFTTAAALGLGAFSLIALSLGLAGWLNQASAVALLAAGNVAGIARLLHTGWRGEAQRQWMAGQAQWAWLLLLVVPFVSIMTAGAMIPPYFLWTPQEPHGYDVVEYHLQVPREWYEAGRIIPLHHNVFSFFPFNVEMHYLLAMHLRGGPWAGMYLAQFMHGAMLLLCVLAACGFARRLAYNTRQCRFAPLIAALAMLSTPWIAQLGAIAYDEGGFLLFGTLAIGWAAIALRDPEKRIPRFILAGVMAGLSCGSKLTAVPEILVAISLVSLLLLARVRWDGVLPFSRRVAGPFAFGLVGTLCFAPWLIRNSAWAGNPVFPELAPILGHGDFSQVQVERWHRAHTPQPAESSFEARIKMFGIRVLGSWQYGFLLIPLGVVSIVWNRRDPDVWFFGAMLFLLTIFWLGFTHLQSRFFILAVPICALLIARLPARVGSIILLQAVIGFIWLQREFARVEPLIPSLGTESFEGVTPLVVQQNVSPDDMLILVGDAKAFFYQRPMSRLRYRTIFDADTSNGRGVIDAWAGSVPSPAWLLIDPNELRRFESYQPFPPLPAEISSRRESFLMRR